MGSKQRICVAVCVLRLFVHPVFGQTPYIPYHDAAEILENLPEETIELMQEQSGLLEDFQNLTGNPLDLNTALPEDFERLYLLSPSEIEAILQYRNDFGPFIHPNELQVIEGLTPEKVQGLLPFVTVTEERDVLSQGDGYVLARSAGYFPKRQGFRSEPDREAPYDAGPLGLLIKFRKYRSRYYSWGGSMELDAGERFSFKNRPGFDHIHGHYYRTGRPGVIRTLALGDYRISLGQGLLQYQGFAITRPSNPLLYKRVAPVIQPYTGSSEFYYFRGAAIELATHPRIQNFLFFHRKNRDATLRTDVDVGQPYFSAFQTSGLHRTTSENGKRRQVAETVAGHRIQWKKNRWKFGLNSLFQKFSLPYRPVHRIDNLHRLTGTTLMGHSLDFSGYLGSLHVFGEVATQNYRTPAFLVSMLYSFHERLDAGILIRRFPAYYAPLYANAFSARTIPNNESGLYVGLNYHIGPYSRLSLYLDSWKGFWPTYQAHGPTFDHDIFLKYEMASRRKWEAYGQIKFRHRADNLASGNPEHYAIGYNDQVNVRLQFRKINYQKWRWTNRLEIVRFTPEAHTAETGVLLFTDLLWSPIGQAWSVAGRLAWFRTDSYFSRIYAYEPDITYSFTIPFFYFEGWRLAARVSYKLQNGIRLELRTGWTFLPGAEKVGSGLNAVPGPFSQQLKMQVMYRF